MIVAIQMRSGCEPEENFSALEQELEKLPDTRPMLVCLPESWLCFAADSTQPLALAEKSELWIERIGRLVKKHGIWLNAGTIPMPAIPMQEENKKYYAASLLFNDMGEVAARYNKIHLFDVDVSDKTGSYRESDSTRPGDHICVADTPLGKVGLSVCYDMRFPALYSALRCAGAEIILVPSAFTKPTGEAHWHTLLRARAIETQCYLVAAAQSGTHENGRETYGHSLIVDPWGEVVAELAEKTGQITCQTDLARLQQIRARMPIASHSRFRESKL